MAARSGTIASTLLASVLRPSATRLSAPAYRTYATNEPKPHERKTSSEDAPAVKLTSESTQIREEGAAEGMRHQPDYNVAVDYRTSNFSPIPKRVMDGSEPGDSVAAAVLSGAPTDLQARSVRIYKPSKTATQSGDWNASHWLMDWDVLPKGHRWENPLMGWQSSADFMNGHRMQFKSKEDAINFANKQGYEYFVQEPNKRKFVPKAYANLFTHVPGKLKVVRTNTFGKGLRQPTKQPAEMGRGAYDATSPAAYKSSAAMETLRFNEIKKAKEAKITAKEQEEEAEAKLIRSKKSRGIMGRQGESRPGG
ncbi:hypothetical protein BDW02DRAFT_585178 [Decorospora gaudefroyi]|uniref:NADH dehydrogenase [ubiquinone] iron-sulfur protein 4, mitochondrial n=1 Tax=Decorospora gaudefroyi TaxID=184978 RepID=A0A6A5KVX5_9PLEO|nr:hypothetical protein BDW02DRAFT_585178 [Decorospora gaudefroyi]